MIMSRRSTEAKKTSTNDVKNITASRLYRKVLEYVRRLENGRQHRRNLISVFQSEQIGLRHQLRDACEKLMFKYPLEYGKKAEELLWRKVYYEVIQLMKTNKKVMKEGSRLEVLFKQYLSSAVGYYHHLLLKLQAYYHPDINVDWPLAASPLSEKSFRRLNHIKKVSGVDSQNAQGLAGREKLSADGETGEEEERKKLMKWTRDACYRMFICLGDLGRYQIENGGSRVFSERFYQLAILINPAAGMPFNQLGTLAGHHTWWGLTAAYYYYRCLECESKFEGADGNLQKLLDRNKKTFYQIPTDALEEMICSKEYRKEHTKTFIVSFLYLCDLLRPRTYATDVEITGLCKKLIDSFPVCLSNSAMVNDKEEQSDVKDKSYIEKEKQGRSFLFKRQSSSSSSHHHHSGCDYSRMQPHVIFKMCVLCIVNIHNLQSTRSNRSSAAIAFALAFFSHLLGHVIFLLSPKQEVNGITASDGEESENCIASSNGGDGDASNLKTKENEQRKKRKARLASFRRRRHLGSGDSDLSEGEIFSDLSDSDGRSESESTVSSNSELSQEERSQEEVTNVVYFDGKPKNAKSETSSEKKLQPKEILDNRAGLQLANSLANGTSALASLKDISQKMFQPMPRRRIVLAPSFFNNVSPPSTQKSEQDHKTASERMDLEKGDASDITEIMNNTQDLKHNSVSPVTNENGIVSQATRSLYVKVAELSGGRGKLHKLNNMASNSEIDGAEKDMATCENTPTTKDSSAKNNANQTSLIKKTENNTAMERVSETSQSVRKETGLTSDEAIVKVFHQMMQYQQLFSALKLLCDWLAANVKVTEACAQNSKALWSRLTRLANLLPDENKLREMAGDADDSMLSTQLDTLKSCISQSGKWQQQARIAEDFTLNCLTVSVNFSDEENKKPLTLECNLTDLQQNVIRICRIRSFCYSLTHVEGLTMSWDQKTGLFQGPSEPSEEEIEHLDISAVEDMRKTRLMKDMAELRLRNEVNTLESELGTPRSRDASLCLYLVPDALALCHDLHHIRRLLGSEKFFIIIPKTVIDGLDGLKKDLQGARDAIRFLENEFKKGNRFIRAQVTDEASKGVQGERPKLRRNDMQAWRFYRIIECCRFVAREKAAKKKEIDGDSEDTSAGSGGENQISGSIAILTHSTDKTTLSQNQINAISAAENIGIQVYSASQFNKLWRKMPQEK